MILVYFHALANFVYIVKIGFQTITTDASDYVELLNIVPNFITNFIASFYKKAKQCLLLSQKTLCVITNKDIGYMLNTMIGVI